MEHVQLQQELSIIKEMVSKTRQEAAESGHFFIAIGIFSMIAVFAIGMLNLYHLEQFVLPTMGLMVVISGVIGYLTVNKPAKTEKVKSYPKTICYSVWFACSVVNLMTTFLFPILNVYAWNLVPIFSCLIMGIALFSSGVIFESQPVTISSLVWWGGAVLMVFTPGRLQMVLALLIILFGWVVPGYILNRKYKARRDAHGA